MGFAGARKGGGEDRGIGERQGFAGGRQGVAVIVGFAGVVGMARFLRGRMGVDAGRYVVAETGAMMVQAVLLAMAEGFAGQRLVVDERLLLPQCPAPMMRWADAAGVPARVEVRCDVPAWRVFLPVAAADVAAETVRPARAGLVRMVDDAAREVGKSLQPYVRGQRVVVRVRGQGFSVSLEAVAEGPARDGRLWVRAAGRDRRRLMARLELDGGLVIDGLNGTVKGR